MKKVYIVSLLLISTGTLVNAASLSIESPPRTSPNRSPIVVSVTLDPEKDVLSGMAGNFSFPSDMFTIANISTESSVVSLWVKQPAVADENYLDGRTHIAFEGIFPGGYDGVRSPYYKGVRPGIVFSVTLIPKNKGVGTFMVDDVLLNAFNSEATPLPTQSISVTIENPELLELAVSAKKDALEIESPTLTALITRDFLVNNNAWYLIVNEREQKSSIEKIYVAETDEYHASLVGEYQWHVQKVPYILTYQNRTKYVHVKVLYSNNTYTLRTIEPVENSRNLPLSSRILISVALALLVLYVYAKYFFIPNSQQEKTSN
jgi:hypothetical protein